MSAPARNDRHLTLEQLKGRIAAGEIDTVVIAFTDMQGRLQGKRLHCRYFTDHVVAHGAEGCNYLLAVDVDMNTVDGYAMSSWERGYGDMFFEMSVVPATLTVISLPLLSVTTSPSAFTVFTVPKSMLLPWFVVVWPPWLRG